jgi:hypothetical protein
MNPPTKTSSDHRLTVDFIHLDEPNNGRMLWKVEVKLDNKSIDHLLFSNNWHYINFEIDHWTLHDDACEFFYIPAEGTSKLLVKNSLLVISLPYQPISTITFWGNLFFEDKLIEIYQNLMVITDLIHFKSTIKNYSSKAILSDTRVDASYWLRIAGFEV